MAGETTQAHRLSKGGRINRTKTLSFSFNGEAYQGYAGDTLASALLANGVRTVGRSFKYHRPRGIVGGGAEEPNAILEVGVGARSLPNSRATQVQLYDGLVSRSVNSWPSLSFDLLALNGFFARFLPRRFLLQNVYVATELLEEVRTLHSASFRPGRGSART